jgi:hypothetical protein
VRRAREVRADPEAAVRVVRSAARAQPVVRANPLAMRRRALAAAAM